MPHLAFASLRTALFALATASTLAALAPSSTHAQDATAAHQSSVDAEARSLFEAGRTAFAAGRFEAALARFRDAYELSGRPELLYNIGTAADRLRRDAEALDAFRAYLAALPQASNRLEVESRVDVLTRAIADDDARAEPEPVVVAPVTLESSSAAEPVVDSGSGGAITEEWWFWTLIAVVVVGAGVGIGVGVATSSGDTTQAPLPGTTGSVAIALGAW